MPFATAWHLTFNTYGTWLPGDPRGFIDRKGATLRARIREGDQHLHEYHKRRLTHPEVRLDANARRIVRAAIEDYCAFKKWNLLAINVRTNHVHVVVGSFESPSKMLNAIKARATRMLREAGLFEPAHPVWSERGNKNSLNSPAAVKEAINYVLHKQGPALSES